MASDGWSNSIIVTELIAYYEEFTLGNPFIYKELPVQYADYALWQRNYLHGTLLESKLSYWKSKLKDFTILELPIDKPRPALQSIRGAYKGFYIDHDLTEKLETLSKQLGTTMFMTLISTFKVLLFRYTGQTDIMVGTPVAGRQLQELEVLIGYFINTLALRTEIQSENSFIDLVSSVKTTSKEAFEHQDVPYEKVVEALIPSRDMSRSPLFQAVFGYHNMPDIPEFKLGEIVLKNEPAVVKTVKFELTLSVTQGKEGMRAGFEYCTDLFEESTIERMISHYVRILEVVCDKPNIPVSQIDLLNKDDRAKIASFNQTESAYPANASIVDLFENQVKNSPDATAIVFEGTRLSYQELNQRANKVANALIKLGIKTESLVPICLDRSIELMVGILGILKSGGAYLPIDTSYPKERIRFMLDETKSNVAITNEISKYLVDECDHILVLNESLFSNSELDTKNPTIQILPNNLAYVMFTSGSTGMPKGTMIEHRNVVSLAVGSNFTSFNSHDLILSTGSTAFDATTIEYWGMLLNGGSLVLCSEEQLMDSELLKSQIESNKITKMWFTSSWFNQLVDNNITLFSSLKTIMVGGEKLSAVHIQKMRATYPEIELINGYGPTENTTFSLTYTIKEEQITKAIPIGKPLSNRKAYILDSNLNLVPIGVAGEIYLAGAGLSRGYLNRDDLNKEKFFKSPFVETEKIYKTGDLGRWLPSGDIEYLGRTDDQVKIRGYRIELGEIEETILNSGLVSQCVIVAKEYQTSKRLVAYIVNKAGHDKSDISNYLQNVLPEYMIPQLWVEMENLPLTTNGKIDKRVLPEIDIEDQIKHKYVAPQNEIEKKLVKIWEEILEVDPIGVYDNFFELGGHSLLAIRMIFCIERDINLKIPIQMIFNFEKISDLARYIETELKGNLSDDNDKAYKTIEI
jgi:amino acid adenylation domain-containing protein